jgi:drug/metabolite transporter (DMT)-like permease
MTTSTLSQKNPYWAGIAIGLLGAALFSAKAIIVKLAYRYNADATSLLGLRMVVAMPFFLFAAWYVDYSPVSKVNPARISPWKSGDVWKILALGLTGYYAASYLDFLGLKYISAGLERVILYLNPTIVLLISVFWLKKKIGVREYAALLTSYCGVFIVFWNDVSLVGSKVALGASLVFASALCYAVYLSGVGEMVKRLGSLRLTAYASLVSTAACVIQSLVVDRQAMFNQTKQVYQLSLINGVFCTVVPVFLVMAAIARVGSSVAAQTSMFGPVATIFLAAWFLQEPFTVAQLIGTLVVMSGIFILSFKPKGK